MLSQVHKNQIQKKLQRRCHRFSRLWRSSSSRLHHPPAPGPVSREQELPRSRALPCSLGRRGRARPRGDAPGSVLRARRCGLPGGTGLQAAQSAPRPKPPLPLLPSYLRHCGDDAAATASWGKRTRDANNCSESSGSLRASAAIVLAPSVLEAAARGF